MKISNKNSHIKVGYKIQSDNFISFNKQDENKASKNEAIYFDGSSHIITIASTGSGKGVCSAIPNLLQYTGPVISLDPKGEQLHVVKEAREKMGHNVVILDPFSISGYKSDSINPLDISILDNFIPDTDSLTIAENLANQGGSSSEPFWDLSAKSLISGMIQMAWMDTVENTPTLIQLRDQLCHDTSWKIEVALDTKKNIPKSVKAAFVNFLNAPEEKTRPSIQITAGSYFSNLYADSIERFLSKTSFKLYDIVEGKNTDIFIIFPPDKLESHSHLLRLILLTLFKAILSRNKPVKQKTLFILDECASLGKFPLLESMISLSRGYGVIIQTIWQDLSQIKKHYPTTYLSFLNNSGMWQFFGKIKYNLAQEISLLTGISANEIMCLGQEDQILYIDNLLYKRASRVNYLKDKEFRNRYNKNPFYDLGL